MDNLKFWIWEHAHKYHMTKVLQEMNCSFSDKSLPSCWLSASFLRRIRDDWNKPENKITSDDLNNLKTILNTTFKYFKKELKQVIRTVDFIHLEFYCKASFLVLRSSGHDYGLKIRARNELFPIWNDLLWNRIRQSFGLKNDILMDEIKLCHLDIRNKLSQPHLEKAILNTFEALMIKHFPSLIAFLQRVKLSILERIQLKRIVPDTSYEFILPHLNGGLGNEFVLLNLLEAMERKQITDTAIRFLKEKSKVVPAKTDNTGPSSITATLFTLPPDFMDRNDGAQIYPPCFGSNPFMPTYIVLEKDGKLQEFEINRSVPRHPDGSPLGAHWFSDANCPNVKQEKNDSVENEDISVPLPKIQDGLSTQSSTKNTGEKENFIIPETPDQLRSVAGKKEAKYHGLKELKLSIPKLNIDRVQSWINNQEPTSPSSIDSIETTSSLRSDGKRNSPSPKKKVNLSPVNKSGGQTSASKDSTSKIDSDHESKSSQSDSCSIMVDETSETCENPSDAVTDKSFNPRKKRYAFSSSRHLKALSMRSEPLRESESEERQTDGSEMAASEGCLPRLRSQTRSTANDGSTDDRRTLRKSSRLRRTVRNFPSSTDTTTSLGNSSSDSSSESEYSGTKNGSENLSKTEKSTIKTNAKSVSSIETRSKNSAKKSNPASPEEEPSSNYQTPNESVEKNSQQDQQASNVAYSPRASTKRKLYPDDQHSSGSKAKRIPVDCMLDGRRVLPKILETIKRQSDQLRTQNPAAADEINMIYEQIHSSHQKISSNMTEEYVDIADRVKHCSRNLYSLRLRSKK